MFIAFIWCCAILNRLVSNTNPFYRVNSPLYTYIMFIVIEMYERITKTRLWSFQEEFNIKQLHWHTLFQSLFERFNSRRGLLTFQHSSTDGSAVATDLYLVAHSRAVVIYILNKPTLHTHLYIISSVQTVIHYQFVVAIRFKICSSSFFNLYKYCMNVRNYHFKSF